MEPDSTGDRTPNINLAGIVPKELTHQAMPVHIHRINLVEETSLSYHPFFLNTERQLMLKPEEIVAKATHTKNCYEQPDRFSMME